MKQPLYQMAIIKANQRHSKLAVKKKCLKINEITNKN